MSKVTLQNLLDYYGIPLKKTGSSFRILCPFHSDKDPSCSISLQRNQFHCFSCGAGGGIIKFVELKESCDKKAAYNFLRKTFDVQFHENYQATVDPEKESKVNGTQCVGRLNRALNYCVNHGIDYFNPRTLFGALGWAIDKDAISKEEALAYYSQTDEGKKEAQVNDLIDRCNYQISVLKKITKDSKSEFDERPTLLRALEDLLTIRMQNSWPLIRSNSQEFDTEREKLLDLVQTLKHMVSKKDRWIEELSLVDWN